MGRGSSIMRGQGHSNEGAERIDVGRGVVICRGSSHTYGQGE